MKLFDESCEVNCRRPKCEKFDNQIEYYKMPAKKKKNKFPLNILKFIFDFIIRPFLFCICNEVRWRPLPIFSPILCSSCGMLKAIKRFFVIWN